MLSEELKNWNIQKAKLKKQFAYLTDEDLTYAEGKKEAMLERLQITLGKTKGDLMKMIDSL